MLFVFLVFCSAQQTILKSFSWSLRPRNGRFIYFQICRRWINKSSNYSSFLKPSISPYSVHVSNSLCISYCVLCICYVFLSTSLRVDDLGTLHFLFVFSMPLINSFSPTNLLSGFAILVQNLTLLFLFYHTLNL